MKTTSTRGGIARTPSRRPRQVQVPFTLSQRQFRHLLLLLRLGVDALVLVLGLLDLLAELLDLLGLVLVLEAEGLINNNAFLALFLHRFQLVELARAAHGGGAAAASTSRSGRRGALALASAARWPEISQRGRFAPVVFRNALAVRRARGALCSLRPVQALWLQGARGDESVRTETQYGPRGIPGGLRDKVQPSS